MWVLLRLPRFRGASHADDKTQDPTFLVLGSPDKLKQLSQQDQRTFLSDPQQMNSYSYGRDNPITQKDPNGNSAGSEIVEHLVDIEGVNGSIFCIESFRS